MVCVVVRLSSHSGVGVTGNEEGIQATDEGDKPFDTTITYGKVLSSYLI